MTRNELKDIIKECISEESANTSVSESENFELIAHQQFMIESLLAVIEADEEDEEEDVVEEGANLDARAEFKKYKKEYKDAARACNKAIKKKDKKTALAESKKMDKALEDVKKTINTVYSQKGSIGSAIWGYFTNGLVDFPRVFLLTLATLPVAGIGGLVASVEDLINGIKVLIEDIKKDEDLDNTLNLYRNQLLAYIKRLESANKKLQSKINEL